MATQTNLEDVTLEIFETTLQMASRLQAKQAELELQRREIFSRNFTKEGQKLQHTKQKAAIAKLYALRAKIDTPEEAPSSKKLSDEELKTENLKFAYEKQAKKILNDQALPDNHPLVAFCQTLEDFRRVTVVNIQENSGLSYNEERGSFSPKLPNEELGQDQIGAPDFSKLEEACINAGILQNDPALSTFRSYAKFLTNLNQEVAKTADVISNDHAYRQDVQDVEQGLEARSKTAFKQESQALEAEQKTLREKVTQETHENRGASLPFFDRILFGIGKFFGALGFSGLEKSLCAAGEEAAFKQTLAAAKSLDKSASKAERKFVSFEAGLAAINQQEEQKAAEQQAKEQEEYAAKAAAESRKIREEEEAKKSELRKSAEKTSAKFSEAVNVSAEEISSAINNVIDRMSGGLKRAGDNLSSLAASAASLSAKAPEQAREANAPEVQITKQELKSNLAEMLSGCKTPVDLRNLVEGIGGEIHGSRVSFPAMQMSGDAHPSNLSFDYDLKKQHVTKVELYGGDRAGHKRELYEGDNVKPKHAANLGEMLENLREKISANNLSQSAKEAQDAGIPEKLRKPSFVERVTAQRNSAAQGVASR